MSLHASFEGSLTSEIPLKKELFFSNTPKFITESGVIFDIDKRADIVFYLSEISSMTVEYESRGDFLLTYSSVLEIKPQELLDPFTIKVKVMRGEGELTLDLRGTRSWSQESSPIITLEGTGIFKIKRIIVEKVGDAKEYVSGKNRAFFWIPEIPRLTTVLFLTPTYLDISGNQSLAGGVGSFFIMAVVFMLVIRLFSKNKQKIEKYFIYMSLFVSFVFAAHFMVRFVPNMNMEFYLENEEKIKKYNLNPELGELASATRKYIGAGDKVAVSTAHNDKFGREMLCFNVAPADCVFYEPLKSTLWGMRAQRRLRTKELDALVSYNASFPPPEGFEKVYVKNRNVYIARKK